MTEPPALLPLLAKLAEDLADQVVHRYRVSRDEATSAIIADWSCRLALLDVAAKATGLEQVKRTRVYREAAAAVKKDLYYSLRRYHPEHAAADAGLAMLARLDASSPASEQVAAIDKVAREHVSTAERLPHLAEFFDRLIAMVGVPETIVDVGCGMFPLVVPLDGVMRATREYWALEKDQAVVAAMREYARLRADDRVRPLEWGLALGWTAAHNAGLPERSDVGLLLKVVPVVARQSSTLLAVLTRTPAERLVISGSRVAMAKRLDIERRETHILQRFFADHELIELGSFKTPDEVVFLVRRS